MNKSAIKVLIIIFVLLGLISLPFNIEMNKHFAFNDSTSWADFGSYIGGIVSIFTLFATLYIAFKIEENSNARHDKDVEVQKTLFLNDIRIKEYEKLIDLLNLNKCFDNSIINPDLDYNKQVYLSLIQMRGRLYDFCIQNDDIFNLLRNTSILDNLVKSIDNFAEYYSLEFNMPDQELFKKMSDQFVMEKDLFCKKIRQLILSN
jgi:hypothetical protein